jgi:hypothetical protein
MVTEWLDGRRDGVVLDAGLAKGEGHGDDVFIDSPRGVGRDGGMFL